MGKLYVGNLPFKATEEEVKELFESCGEVSSVKLISDRETGRPRGFGFVEMPDITKAIAELDGKVFKSASDDREGRALKVNEAQDRNRR